MRVHVAKGTSDERISDRIHEFGGDVHVRRVHGTELQLEADL